MEVMDLPKLQIYLVATGARLSVDEIHRHACMWKSDPLKI
jgi:hypothetical protein